MNPRLSIAASAILLAAALPAAAHTLTFATALSGAGENNPSPATGTATVIVDEHTLTMQVQASFQGLQSNTFMAHIHCCQNAPASSGIAVPFDDFPTGVRSGSYSSTINLALPGSWSAAFLAAHGGNGADALAALVDGILSGQAYFNVHTLGAPAGEIRGYLAPVPEPATWALMLGGLAVAGAVSARRRPGQPQQG